MLVAVGMPIGRRRALLIIAYARIDQVIVFASAGSREAGLYGAVYNMLDQAHFVPVSILTTLSPVIAAAWPADRDAAAAHRAADRRAARRRLASAALAFAIVAAAPGRAPDLRRRSSRPPRLRCRCSAAAFVLICFGYLNGNLLVVLGLQRRLLRHQPGRAGREPDRERDPRPARGLHGRGLR